MKLHLHNGQIVYSPKFGVVEVDGIKDLPDGVPKLLLTKLKRFHSEIVYEPSLTDVVNLIPINEYANRRSVNFSIALLQNRPIQKPLFGSDYTTIRSSIYGSITFDEVTTALMQLQRPPGEIKWTDSHLELFSEAYQRLIDTLSYLWRERQELVRCRLEQEGGKYMVYPLCRQKLMSKHAA